MSNSLKTSLIIPVYAVGPEQWDMTWDCLDSLQDRPDQVIVVDDGSPFYNKEIESKAISHLGIDHYVHQPNRGFAGAVNAGLAVATGDIVMQANNDILFTPGWLEGILRPLEMGFDISSIRTSDQPTGYATEDKIVEGERFGSIWAMKRKVYETLGPWDEDFGPGYFEDTDYYVRSLDAGFKTARNNGVLVEHRGHATFDKVDPKKTLLFKNAAIFQKKHPGYIKLVREGPMVAVINIWDNPEQFP